jgi:hypothetical protein
LENGRKLTEYDHFRRAIDKPREIVKIIITKQNDLLIRAHRRFAYIDLIAGDVEIQVFFFFENGQKHTEIRPLEMVHHGLADHHHLLGGFVSTGIHMGNS